MSPPSGAPIDWPIPLKKRKGGRTLLHGTQIYYDFDWRAKLGHSRSIFPNCKSIGRKIKALTPPGSKAILLLTERTDVPFHSIEVAAPGEVVHVLNIDAAINVAADPADTLFGKYATPDINLAATIEQLRNVPGALDALIAEQLHAEGVLNWATVDDERIEDLVSALGELDPVQLARVSRLALSIVGSVSSQPHILEESADAIGDDLLRLAAAGTSFATQERAVSDFADLLQGDHPESTFQTFFEKQHWMFGSQFVGRWPGRQITQGNQQDLILLTPDGFVDLIELKRPRDEVLRWDNSRKSYYPAPELAQAIGQVQQYLFDIDSELHRIRSKFNIDVHRARAVIVIGKIESADRARREALRGLNAHLTRIEIWTYTQVMTVAQAIVNHSGSMLRASLSE